MNAPGYDTIPVAGGVNGTGGVGYGARGTGIARPEKGFLFFANSLTIYCFRDIKKNSSYHPY